MSMLILMPEIISFLSEGRELWMIWKMWVLREERLHEKDSMLTLESRLWSDKPSSDEPWQGRVNSTCVMSLPCMKL